MSKHLIKIESTPHGVLGVRHAGLDQQYCEAGETVILKWQPDAKWGLQEAHYTDGDGNVTAIDLTRTKVDGMDVVAFVMPNANITIGGTFKMFVSQDWTEGTNPSKGEVLTVGNNGEPTPISVDELANEIAEGDNNLVDSIDAINPFKGWYANLATLQASHPSPVVGDYAYVKGAESTDPAAIYECTTAGSWSDSGRTADTSNVQTFASSQEVNETYIDDTHLANPKIGALPTAADVMQLKAKLGGVTASETKVTLITSGVGQNVFNGQTLCKSSNDPSSLPRIYVTSSYRYIVIDVEGYKSVRFLGRLSYTTGVDSGWQFYDSSNYDENATSETADNGFLRDKTGAISYGVYDIDTTLESNTTKEYVLDVPSNAKYLKVVCVMGDYLTLDNFYCYLQSGNNVVETMKDVFDESFPNALVTSKENYYSFNRHNRETDVSGYLIQSTGGVGSASSMKTSDFIPVSENGLYVAWIGAYGGTDGGFCVYDENKVKLRGSNSTNIYTYEDGDAYLRFSYTTSADPRESLFGVFDLDPDGTAPTFTSAYTNKFPYQRQTIDKSVISQVIDKACVPELIPSYSLAGGGIMSNATDILAADTSFILTDFPNYIKNNYTISAKLNIPNGTFLSGSYIRLGLMYHFTIKISATTVSLQRYDSNTQSYVDSKTYTHGLDVTETPFVSVELSLDWNGGTLKIVTTDGSFVQSWLISEESYVNYERYGVPYIISSIATTNVKLCATSPMFRKPIWVLGDSYTSMSDARWVYQMVHTFGVDNFMLDGLAGGTSAQLYIELVKMMNFGTPRYLVWCLGMNDIYAYLYYQTIKKVEMLCRDNGIELVLATIPWPTGGNKKDINDYVKASDYRYIDQYAAVSSDDNGTWYSGMNGDGTHPTINGAKAIAAQVLVDFPEIANYN